jgi:hypothetical protein
MNKVDHSAINRRIRREVARLGYAALPIVSLDAASPKLLYLLEDQNRRVMARTPSGILKARTS